MIYFQFLCGCALPGKSPVSQVLTWFLPGGRGRLGSSRVPPGFYLVKSSPAVPGPECRFPPPFSEESGHRCQGAPGNSKICTSTLTSIKVIFPTAQSVLCHLLFPTFSQIGRMRAGLPGFYQVKTSGLPVISLLWNLEFPCLTREIPGDGCALVELVIPCPTW